MIFIKYNSQWHLSVFWFAWHLRELSAYSLVFRPEVSPWMEGKDGAALQPAQILT